jgi:hypothetical protein
LTTHVTEERAAFIIIAQMIEAARTSETSVDNNFTRQYIPEDNSEHQIKIFDKMHSKENRG